MVVDGIAYSFSPFLPVYMEAFGADMSKVVKRLVRGAVCGEYLLVVPGDGLGFGMIYLPAVVCVGYYFEKKRALATGIAVCGSGVGTMLFPPFVKFLLAQYGWRGTNILLAGLVLNAVVGAG
ncbi:hypothetical protein HAZT_HAZT006751, partial [Hyalella azteca]